MTDTDPIPLNLPHGWQTHWHHLTALPPDNDYPPDEVFFHFDEDLTYLTYQDYFIDAGFYGNYLSGRRGNFGLVVARGDFLGGSVMRHSENGLAHIGWVGAALAAFAALVFAAVYQKFRHTAPAKP